MTKSMIKKGTSFGIVSMLILSIAIWGNGVKSVDALTISATPGTNSTAYASITNNAWTALEPLIQKSLVDKTVRSTTETTATAAVDVRYADSKTSDFLTVSAAGFSKDIFNTKTDTSIKDQTTANINVVTGNTIGQLIGNNVNIGLEARSFVSTNNKREYFVRVTNLSPRLLTLINKELPGKNKLKINSWYKVGSKIGDISLPKVSKTKEEETQFNLNLSRVVLSNVLLEQDFGTDSTTLTPSRHFKFGLNTQGLINIYDGLAALTNNQTKSEAERADFIQTINTPEAQQLINATKFEMWVGAENGRIYGLQIYGKNMNFGTQSSIESIKISFDFTTKLKSLNSTFKIDKPTKFIDLQKMIDDSKAEAKTKAKDAAAMATISSLRSSAELYYANNNSYTGLCGTNERYFADGYSKLDTYAQKNKYGIGKWCGAWNQYYLITMQIAPNRYLCIDSNGTLTETKNNRALVANTWTCK